MSDVIDRDISVSMSMSTEDLVEAMTVKPYKVEEGTALENSPFEHDVSFPPDYNHLISHLYSHLNLGLQSIDSETHKRLSIFRIGILASESYRLLANLYIPTMHETGHTSNTLIPIHLVHITTDVKNDMGRTQDVFIKALYLLSIPLNKDCLVLDSVLSHLKELEKLSQLSFTIEVKTSISFMHKRLMVPQDFPDHPLAVLSTTEQRYMSSTLSNYLPQLNLPHSYEEAHAAVTGGMVKMDTLQAFCIYQSLKLYVSKIFYDSGLYTEPCLYIQSDKVHFQLKDTGSMNFKLGILNNTNVLESTFWCLLNNGLILDSRSFSKYVALKQTESSKSHSCDESKNDNIHFKSTCYELLLRLMIDESLKSDHAAIEEAIALQDFEQVLSLIGSLPIFKV